MQRPATAAVSEHDECVIRRPPNRTVATSADQRLTAGRASSLQDHHMHTKSHLRAQHVTL